MTDLDSCWPSTAANPAGSARALLGPGTVVGVTAATPDESASQPPDESALDRIAIARQELDGIADLSPAEAVGRFEAIHNDLQAALADLDES
jgi:hypothetical protein